MEVWDKDYYLNPNDLMGSFDVDIQEIVKNPGHWLINGNYKVEGPEDMLKKYRNFGEVYIQARFLEKVKN